MRGTRRVCISECSSRTIYLWWCGRCATKNYKHKASIYLRYDDGGWQFETFRIAWLGSAGMIRVIVIVFYSFITQIHMRPIYTCTYLQVFGQNFTTSYIPIKTFCFLCPINVYIQFRKNLIYFHLIISPLLFFSTRINLQVLLVIVFIHQPIHRRPPHSVTFQ